MDNFIPYNNGNTISDDQSRDQSNQPTSTGNEGASLFAERPQPIDRSIETEPSSSLEKIPVPEIYKNGKENTGEDTPQTSPQKDVQEKAPQKQPNIVDKSHQPLHTHDIKAPGDKLTEEADKEEEHFIEEVEKHHGG